MQVLSDLKIGQTALITQVNTSGDKQIKLLGLGVSSGVRIAVLRNRGGDMVLALGNARISIGRTLSHTIKVSPA